MFQQKKLVSAIICSTLALTACNSNDDDNVGVSSKAVAPVTTTTITVTPSLGKILNGRIALKNAKTGATLAPTQTITPSSNGTATFTVPVSKIAEPVLAEVLPTTSGVVEYFDEALEQNKTITVATADIAKPILRAAASVTANANIGVTGLTEAAVQQAEKQVGGLIAQNINNANQAVKNALQLNFDVTQAPVVVGKGEFAKLINASISNALEAQRKAYATYLATLAKEAQRINNTSSTPAYDMARAFANDFAHDGAFNGIGSQTLAINYTNTFLTNWLNWVQNFYASFLSLQTIVDFNRWYGGFNIADKESIKNYPDAVPIRTVDGIEEYACSGEGRIKSSRGDSIYMDFINQRGSNINIYWLDANANRVTYQLNLATNQTHNQQTFVTHPWLITDNTGACVGIYKPVTTSKKTITFKANEVLLSGETATPNPTTATCASKKLPATALVNLADYSGDYKNPAQDMVFNLNTTTAKATVKGTQANITEVCGPNLQNNGTNHVLITDKGDVTLFKDTAGVYSAEGFEFADKTKVFEGTKQAVIDPLKPIRIINGVEEYACASWTKIPNGVADGTPIISFVNNLGANTSLTLFGLSSIQRTTTLFTGIQNGATRQQSALKNQMVRVDNAAGECLGVFKSTTNDDQTISFKPSGVVDVVNTNAANTCSSTGNDVKLGFKNAPSDFCSFSYTYGTSTAISSPDIYTFKATNDPMANAKVTVLNGSVQTFQLENSKYAYACGVGEMPACVGMTIQSNTSSNIEFKFTNVQLANVDSTKQGIMIDSGLLMHKKSVAVTTLAATGTASGTVTNVQYNKDGSATGGSGAVTANTYKFSGDLSTAYTLEINDTVRGLRYQLANREGKFTAVNLYSGANSASPLFVYTCDTTGDNTCLAKVTFSLEGVPTLNFTNMKLRGVFQPQFDAIINGQFKLNQ